MIRARWERVRVWVRRRLHHEREELRKCLASAGREVSLQRSINADLARKLKRLETERAELYGVLPGLSPAEIERLALLAEECGGVAQAVGKVLRHGWESSSPYGGRPNRSSLEREVGQLRAVMTLMLDEGDMQLANVQSWQRNKRSTLPKWTHYQADSLPREQQLAAMEQIRGQIN